MTYLEIEIAGVTMAARLLDQRTPRTCAALLKALPFTGRAVHTLRESLQDGAVKPPSIKTAHAGEQHFLFTPTPTGAALPVTKREIYERDIAPRWDSLCIRQRMKCGSAKWVQTVAMRSTSSNPAATTAGLW